MQVILGQIHKSITAYDGYPSSGQGTMNLVRDLTLAVHTELSEMLSELPWKPWKKGEAKPYEIEKAQKELIDALIFLLEIWCILNEEGARALNLKGEILNKVSINMARLETHEHNLMSI